MEAKSTKSQPSAKANEGGRPSAKANEGGGAGNQPSDKKCCEGIFCCSTIYHNTFVISLVVLAIIIILSLACKVFKLFSRRRDSTRSRRSINSSARSINNRYRCSTVV